MNTLASYLRRRATEMQPGHFDPAIQFETKSHYGGPELVYILEGDPHKKPILQLTGTKTLTPKHIEALKALGFVFYHHQSKVQLD